MQVKSIKLNFMSNYYMFYDWLSSDSITEFKNVNVYRVDSQTLSDFLEYNVTILKNSIYLPNKPLLFSDTFSYVGIIFDHKGKSILKSSLSLEDEFKISKQIGDLRLSKIPYHKSLKDNLDSDLRLNHEIKQTIINELDDIAKENNTDKLTYYYYEWFNVAKKDEKQMLKKMYASVNNITEKEIYICDLIKKSNKVV